MDVARQVAIVGVARLGNVAALIRGQQGRVADVAVALVLLCRSASIRKGAAVAEDV